MKTANEKRVLSRFHYHVEPAKIRELADAIGDPNPVYRSLEAARSQGFQAIPVPPTFATVIDFWGGFDFDTLVSKLELNALQVLHGEQEYEYIEQVYVGDHLEAEVKVLKQNERKNMKFIVLETTYQREGKTVLISRSTVIERKG
ncbi:acyl dehydratase [Bacillus ectoiniformans]|uniref:FAS1-like dehydratase domain-containing protein n=1 Tax=Bacillus ectoiniformans TaxID=1494429 RepID=UPI0019586C78|nr:MaoC family dehydratase N-terminal domain-containing protein [Bacillus ectoiniformans]MBM7647714.1 acyl dehydratase [Bacillus ectoiniformans]